MPVATFPEPVLASQAVFRAVMTHLHGRARSSHCRLRLARRRH